jgi:hypothetical protein
MTTPEHSAQTAENGPNAAFGAAAVAGARTPAARQGEAAADAVLAVGIAARSGREVEGRHDMGRDVAEAPGGRLTCGGGAFL